MKALFSSWVETLKNPRQVFASPEVLKSKTRTAFLELNKALLFAAIILVVKELVDGFFYGSNAFFGTGLLIVALWVSANVLLAAATTVYIFFAAILKGKGSLAQQTAALSKVFSTATVFSVLFYFVKSVLEKIAYPFHFARGGGEVFVYPPSGLLEQFAGGLLNLVNIVFFVFLLYCLYLLYLALKKVHKFEPQTALLELVSFAVAVVVFYALVVGVFMTAVQLNSVQPQDLYGVPLVGDFFRPNIVKVTTVGKASQAFDELVTSLDFKEQGIIYAMSLNPEHVNPGVLQDFDVVIVQGEEYCHRPARKELADFVENGGKLVVVGNACTKVADDPTATGWSIGENNLGKVMPVRLIEASKAIDDKLKIVAVYHPMFNGIVNFGFEGDAAVVELTDGSEVLAYFGFTDTERVDKKPLPAIASKKTGKKGEVIYFAFDPADAASSRNLLLNLLLYLGEVKQ